MYEAILSIFGTEEDIQELHSHKNELFYPDICWTAMHRWLREHYMDITLSDARPTNDSNKLIAKALMIASALHEFICSPVNYGHYLSDYVKLENTVNQALSELEDVIPGLHHITIQVTDDEGAGADIVSIMNRAMEETLSSDKPSSKDKDESISSAIQKLQKELRIKNKPPAEE